MKRKSFLQALAVASLVLVFAAADEAQIAGPRRAITQVIDENSLVTLAGNTRPETKRANDLGPAANDLHLDMYLQLKRSPEQELAAEQFVESLTDKASPNFHNWITAAEYGQRFGAASEDIATVSHWLESHGFIVNGIPVSHMVIDFSGTAGQVREALHTEIHNIEVGGRRYFANMSDPQIPAALQPAVTGIVSLSNFMPHPMFVARTQYTVNQNEQFVVPGDLATIYNLNPAFTAGYTGQGQTIVVVEDTDLFGGTHDWGVFRQTFGLAQYPYGSLTQVHPAPGAGGACGDPGVTGDEAEAAIDVEWASAAAPNAAIMMASCTNTTNFGGFIALQNLLTNGGPIPGIVSISYGQSETESGAAFNNYIKTLYQMAAAAGVSIFVSSGDSAAAGNDRGGTEAIYGVNVSSFADTIYNVAVGGTDFGDSSLNANSTYWNSTNGVYYNSAKSYIPEIPWNNSCGSLVLANFLGFATTYGSAGLCNSANYSQFIGTIGGSGGPSGCATGAPTITNVVSGTCAGYAKPSWQSIFGNPGDGVRDLPDVALFAANGLWGHYYVVCFSAESSCAGAPSTWAGFGGTSVSAPIMAGIQALINQALGLNNVGNPNPVYYQIGQTEYSTSAGRAACNSTAGPGSTCSFIDVTRGDIDIPCAGAFNCYLAGEALGVLSATDASYAPAYATASGWDFATGIGSVNAFSLLNAFVRSVVTAQPYVDIDSPTPNQALSGTVPIFGWALENISVVGPNAVSSVAVFVDGTQVGTATYGAARSDVCNAYPGRMGCPNVGWNYNLNVSALSSGSHTLKIVATDSAGNTGFNQVNFTLGVPPSVDIDSPTPNQALSGTVPIFGWALENISVVGPNAVSSVAVFVDGTQVGTATYGAARSDVCNAYPGRMGCPNVGWNYNLNVSALSSGSHTLKIVATDSAGNTGFNQVNFTLGVPPSVDIDSPTPNQALSGTVPIFGWALENISVVGPNAVSSVAVFVDGTQVGTATYGAARSDVCNAYPGRMGCPNVGWNYNLNVSALSSGSHTLKIVATDSAGNTGFNQVNFTLGVPPSVDIDSPTPNQALSGTVPIFGWALENISVVGPNAVSSVAVFVDGTQVGTATYGAARSDVCNAYPGRMGCPNVGWNYNLNVSGLTSGSHTLTIMATDSAGNSGANQVAFSK